MTLAPFPRREGGWGLGLTVPHNSRNRCKSGKLHESPEYKLSHHQLNLGFTLHTTWLQQVAAAPTREYDIKQDFDELVTKCMRWHSPEVAQEIDELFEEAYQAFNRNCQSV